MVNPGLKGRSLDRAFDTDEYNVMLVANKFQTGFDQPLLVAMYFDKKLSGVTAVQTLSRLNRTFRGKSSTYVLDFVNNPDDILAAFEPYYRQTTLAGPSDPNVIHDIRDKLDAAQIYTDSEVDGLAAVYGNGEGNNALTQGITPGKSRFLTQIDQATTAGDGPALEALKLFRSDLGAYVRAYDFLSQVIDYRDPALEKRALFYRLLSRVIVDKTGAVGIDLSSVEMTCFKAHKQDQAQLALGGGADPLRPMTAAGAGTAKDPKLARLSKIVTQLNGLFDDVAFSDADRVAIHNHILGKMAETESLQEQAKVNNEKQFSDSPDVGKAFVSAVVDAMTNHSAMSEKLLANQHLASEFVALLVPDPYRQLKDTAA
ncbi:type I restriction endonuclease subunit R [Nakamurella deserti]|uniref:type I restriction enzyme subunit R domain-containing protein n=1 Tax=Nakamurella deserti TaxID=2164074 RepID=UPI000DBE4C46